MKKNMKDSVQLGNYILIFIVVLIILGTWLYMSYTSLKNIEYSYSGIKYQIGNLQSSEPINIEIKGKFSKELFGEHGNYGEFNGTIKVGEKIFSGPIKFNKDKMGSLISNEKQYGMIYIEGMLEKLTIEVDQPDGNVGYTWSGRNGLLISAPCTKRAEAVEISNNLIGKIYESLDIK